MTAASVIYKIETKSVELSIFKASFFCLFVCLNSSSGSSARSRSSGFKSSSSMNHSVFDLNVTIRNWYCSCSPAFGLTSTPLSFLPPCSSLIWMILAPRAGAVYLNPRRPCASKPKDHSFELLLKSQGTINQIIL